MNQETKVEMNQETKVEMNQEVRGVFDDITYDDYLKAQEKKEQTLEDFWEDMVFDITFEEYISSREQQKDFWSQVKEQTNY